VSNVWFEIFVYFVCSGCYHRHDCCPSRLRRSCLVPEKGWISVRRRYACSFKCLQPLLIWIHLWMYAAAANWHWLCLWRLHYLNLSSSIHWMLATIATLDNNATFHAAQLLDLPCTGMVPIFLSWIISPVLSGIFTTIIFLLIRTLILRRKNSLTKAMIGLPILVGGTFWLVVSFIIQTGTKNKTWSNRGGTFSPVSCQITTHFWQNSNRGLSVHKFVSEKWSCINNTHQQKFTRHKDIMNPRPWLLLTEI